MFKEDFEQFPIALGKRPKLLSVCLSGLHDLLPIYLFIHQSEAPQAQALT